ncbi:MAG: M61 family metallopeptidase [Gammaproteobacteria bacterium]
MKRVRFVPIAGLVALLCLPALALAAGESAASRPVTLTVNLSDAAHSIYGVQMTIPVSPGPLTLAYPKWIPGAHAPVGPITHLAGLVITANGKRIRWRRDPVKMYEFHLTVPAGVSSLDVKMNMVGMHNVDPQLADMAWNSVLLYPYGKPVRDYRYQANLVLPAGWKYASALTTTGRDGNTVHFATTSLYTLVDSPVMAGAYYRKVPLAKSPRVTLDLFADNAHLLTTLDAKTIAAYRKLPAQEYAMFGGYHYQHYDFLMSLSNFVGNGLEHHQSSEDGAGADYYANPKRLLAGADLLTHEYTHSWNGKFMRPAGLDTPDYQIPMRDKLLWVYEGLTQYIGQVMPARIGLWTKKDYREQLAYWAAHMAHRTGRSWRDLADTAVAAPLRFRTKRAWANYKRMNGLDLYIGGVLLWLDVDTKIRQLSHGRRSLNDFCKLFFGRDDHSMATIPYTFDNVVSALNEVQPYDWGKFLHGILDRMGKHAKAPLAGITQGGWKLVYTPVESAYMKAMSHHGVYGGAKQTLHQMYSIGLKLDGKGEVEDVLWNGPAFEAGLAPGMTITAVNGAAFTPDAFTQAITAAKTDKAPIKLLVKNKSWYVTFDVDYHGGLKYPHLERVKGTPDYLDQILSPLPVK